MARAQEERLRRVMRAAEDSSKAVAEAAVKESVALTSGPQTTTHTHGRGKGFKSRKGLPVGKKTGELSRSWRWVKMGNGRYRLVNVARHAPFVLSGRGFQEELGRRMRGKAREIHISGLRKAIRG